MTKLTPENQSEPDPLLNPPPPRQELVPTSDSGGGIIGWAQQNASDNFGAEAMRFRGDSGNYVLLSDATEVPLGTRCDALLRELAVGWIRFNGTGQAPSIEQGLPDLGYTMLARSALGDLDKTKWELGLDKQPKDPWVEQYSLPMIRCADQEPLIFVATNATSRTAVKRLMSVFLKCARRDKSLDRSSIVLASGTWNNGQREIPVPVFRVIPEPPPGPKGGSLANDLSDDIPFGPCR